MKIIPAKLDVVQKTVENINNHHLTIQINPTQLSMDDIGDFYLSNYGVIGIL